MIPELSERAQRQLLFCYEKMKGHRTAARAGRPLPMRHPSVVTGQFIDSGLYYARADIDGLGLVRIVEQNPRTATVFAAAVRDQDAEIAWVIWVEKAAGRSDYTGWMIAQGPDHTKPRLFTGDQLRDYLNPLFTLGAGP